MIKLILAALAAVRFFVCSVLLLVTMTSAPALSAGIKPKPGEVYENLTSVGSYKFYDLRQGDCSGCVFRNLTLHVDRYGFQFGGTTHDVLIDHVNADLRAPTTGSNFPAGVAIPSEGVRNITIQYSTFRNFRMKDVGGYTNGDGVDCDGRAATLTVRYSYSIDNSDGGWDLKCNAKLVHVTAEGNHRNFRFWGHVEADVLASKRPGNAHIWLSKAARVTIGEMKVYGDTAAPLIRINEPGAQITIKKCVMKAPNMKVLIAGPTKGSVINLGPTCKL